MNIVKCNCGYTDDTKTFGKLEIGSNDAVIGRINDQHCGSVDLFVCPSCGMIYTDMRGRIRIGQGI